MFIRLLPSPQWMLVSLIFQALMDRSSNQLLRLLLCLLSHLFLLNSRTLRSMFSTINIRIIMIASIKGSTNREMPIIMMGISTTKETFTQSLNSPFYNSSSFLTTLKQTTSPLRTNHLLNSIPLNSLFNCSLFSQSRVLISTLLLCPQLPLSLDLLWAVFLNLKQT